MVNNLGNKIKAARVMAGFKQADLAKVIGYERQAISRMENGKRKVDLSEIRLIANATDRPLSFFLEEEKSQETTDNKTIDVNDIKDEDLEMIHTMLDCIRKRYKTEKSKTA